MKKTQIPGIYQSNTGFTVRVSKRDPLSGKQIEKTKKINHSFDIQEAIKVKEELSLQLKSELEEGSGSIRNMSLSAYSAYVDFYQKYRLNNAVAKKNVVELDEYVFRKFIIPHIGSVKVSSINKRVVYHLLDCLRNQMNENGVPFSKETYSRAYRVFKASIRMAYRLGFTTDDPTSMIRAKFPYAKEVKEKKSLSKEDAAKLLNSAESKGEKIYFMVCCLTILGLRCSELKALTWGDLNFAENYISVNKSNHRGVTSNSTKNGTAFEAPMIGLVRDAAERYFNKFSIRYNKSDLLFPSDRSKSYMDNSYIRKVVHRCCDSAKISRVSPHDCRRSANTILLLSQVAPEVCRRVLNHRSSAMTGHYTQISTEQAGEVLDAVWNDIK